MDSFSVQIACLVSCGPHSCRVPNNIYRPCPYPCPFPVLRGDAKWPTGFRRAYGLDAFHGSMWGPRFPMGTHPFTIAIVQIIYWMKNFFFLVGVEQTNMWIFLPSSKSSKISVALPKISFISCRKQCQCFFPAQKLFSERTFCENQYCLFTLTTTP